MTARHHGSAGLEREAFTGIQRETEVAGKTMRVFFDQAVQVHDADAKFRGEIGVENDLMAAKPPNETVVRWRLAKWIMPLTRIEKARQRTASEAPGRCGLLFNLGGEHDRFHFFLAADRCNAVTTKKWKLPTFEWEDLRLPNLGPTAWGVADRWNGVVSA
jgi:hypothetical protein